MQPILNKIAKMTPSKISISAGRRDGTCDTCLIHSAMTSRDGGVTVGGRVYLGSFNAAACVHRAINKKNNGLTVR